MNLSPIEKEIFDDLLSRRPDLASCSENILKAHQLLVECFKHHGTLFTCGNGGSYADALHIAGELVKSFERKRPLDTTLKECIVNEYMGAELSEYLEAGLRAIPLGMNSSLKTAIENDCPMRDIAFAQELNVLMNAGDILLTISTSGNAKNCLYAVSVARAKKGTVIAMTGPSGGLLSKYAHVCIKVPGATTKVIQEAHQPIWHTLCAMVEAHFFPEKR
ncbi:MAG TPA: SIS domain-containing protein [Candidatus Hydrogenedens sp.]|nr:SIS domain-containing protein [Candidatus Hydrogenedens sp.]HOK10128.1 SIS domain-containing protein [Candidatus Hydrogenedens sp.]HOL21199.1 SIS domain-containing protein [Candidatus Hydrogenedens sp.]HPP58274.1 SIS domain-containing protein [Candidatus Hydrogenedens sp.]